MRRFVAIPWPSWLGAVVLAGLVLRVGAYLRDPSVWHDEAALMQSVLVTSWSGLLGPLAWNEAAPPLFVALEKGLTGALGTSTFVFRFVPLLASCLGLILFAWTARQIAPPSAAWLAVALVAFSDHLVRHAIEAKPYAMDVLVASLALMAVVTLGTQNAARWLWALTLVAPLAIWISFPACFVLGGLWLAACPVVWRLREKQVWAAWASSAISMGLSFLALAAGPVRAQRSSAMEHCWTGFFPDWSDPASVLLWLVTSTAEAVGYGLSPMGWILAPAAVWGGWSLYRQPKKRILVACLAPAALALAASLMHGYPFGGARVVAFLAPACALLTAVGVDAIVRACRERSPAVRFLPAGLVLPPLALTLAHVALLHQTRPDVRSAAQFVRERKSEGDSVTTNAWEPHIYFQDDAQFVADVSQAWTRNGRLWAIVVSQNAPLRREWLDAVPSNWVARGVYEFHGVTVADFDRRAFAEADSKGGKR